MSRPPLIIGLTGGVASGKSLASATFRELGVEVLDADQVSRQVVEPGEPALAEIAEAFGQDALLEDGTLNRAHMRRRVFSDPGARKTLEQITHPRIRAAIDQWLAQCSGPYAMIENAILIESCMYREVDRVLVVDVPEALQRERLKKRDGIEQSLIDQMLAAQMAREKRLEHADDIIDNSAGPDQLAARVRELHAEYQRLSAAPNQ